MNKEALFISLDIGGTKASGIAVNLQNEFVLPISSHAQNLRSTSEKKLKDFISIIADKLQSRGIETNDAVWLAGCAGARPQYDLKRWEEAMTALGITPAKIAVYCDYETNHSAAFAGGDGILSVNGTGSILFGKHGDIEIRRGGWGFLLDSAPSGAEFGRLALQQVLGAIEGDFGGKKLLEEFKKYFTQLKPERSVIIDWLYADPALQRRLGEAAPVLTRAADNDDPMAKAIIASTLRYWAADVGKLANELNFESTVTLVGIGGLWFKWQSFTKLAENVLNNRNSGRFHIRKPIFPPSWGPLVRYLSSFSGGIDEETFHKLRRLAALQNTRQEML